MLVFKNILKVLFFVVLFVVVFVVSFPKDRVYFGILEQLAKKDIAVESFEKDISMGGVALHRNKIFLSDAHIASVSNIEIGLLSMSLERVKLLGSFSKMVPLIDVVDIGLGFGEFCSIRGKFGEVFVGLDLFEQKIIIDAFIDKTVYAQYRGIFGKFKQHEKGYRYEYSF